MSKTKKYTLREAIEELQTIAASEVLETIEGKGKKNTIIQEKAEEFKKTRAQQTLMWLQGKLEQLEGDE